MMGQLVRDEVFLGAASFTISQDRQEVIKFSQPIDLQPYTFMFQRPQELSRTLLFIKPFTNLVRTIKPFDWL